MLQYFEVIGKDEIICVHTELPLTAEELSDMFKKEFKQSDSYTYKLWKKEKEKQVCRICGCTYFKPCPGGCYWIQEDLCSACAENI